MDDYNRFDTPERLALVASAGGTCENCERHIEDHEWVELDFHGVITDCRPPRHEPRQCQFCPVLCLNGKDEEQHVLATHPA